MIMSLAFLLTACGTINATTRLQRFHHPTP